MGIKEIFLNKGWAGKTISRAETVERLNPIIRIMNELMQNLNAISARGDRAEIDAPLRILKMDIGKMCEIIFSCGDVAYSGTDLDPKEFLGADALAVSDCEARLENALEIEHGIEHQMHTRAILGNVDANQKSRIQTLRNLK